MTAMPQGNSSDAYVTPGAGNSWSSPATEQAGVRTQRLLEVATVDPTDAVRDELGLAVGEHVVVRSRLMMLDECPIEVASSYYPAAIAAGTPLAEVQKIRGGAVSALAALGFTAADVDEQVTARLPTTEEAALLDVPPGEPLLVLSRTSRDRTGRPIEHAVNRMVARRTGPVAYRMRASR